MKKTMNKRDIRRFHGFLDEDLSIAQCSKAMKITVETLKKFMPEQVAISEDAKAKVAKKAKDKAEGKVEKPIPASKK